MNTGANVDAENNSWQADDRTSPGIHIKLLKQSFVFPSLLEDVATQRLTHLREPARTEKFTPATRPHITGLFVTRVSIPD